MYWDLRSFLWLACSVSHIHPALLQGLGPCFLLFQHLQSLLLSGCLDLTIFKDTFRWLVVFLSFPVGQDWLASKSQFTPSSENSTATKFETSFTKHWLGPYLRYLRFPGMAVNYISQVLLKAKRTQLCISCLRLTGDRCTPDVLPAYLWSSTSYAAGATNLGILHEQQPPTFQEVFCPGQVGYQGRGVFCFIGLLDTVTEA